MTPTQIKAILPLCRDTQMWSLALAKAEPFSVDTPARWAAFIAQVGHESAQLNRLVENLSYGIRGLMATWPKRFPNETTAMPYARNPIKLANYVYGDRLGNGPPPSGEGFRYRGRGLLQTTGKTNYGLTGAALGLDLVARPGLLEIPDNAVKAAAYYWQSNGLNLLADEGTEDAFKAITKRINGGYTGYAERLAFWNKAKSVLGVSA